VMRRLSANRARLAEAEAATALAHSEARFHALTDSIPQMAWSCRPDGVPDYFNARWYDFTGTTAEMEGERWTELLHPGDGKRAKAAWDHAVATGEHYEVEYRLKRHDGDYRWTLARGVPVRSADGTITRWFGTNTDIHDRRLLEESRELLGRELSHRIKNIFSLVSGLISFEARSQPELKRLTDAVRARMAALGRAHDYVRPHGQGDAAVTLRGLLADLFAPYEDEGGERIKVHGDDVPISAAATTPLALVFHELATNAVKYGALANEVGVVVVTIRRDGEHTLAIDWRECGGPVRDGAGAASFGTNLIDMSVERQLRGSIERGWDGGFTATIRVPTTSLG
jgi:PAS domain S-box-containing protein